MPGILTHLTVAFIGAVIIYFISRKKVYSFAFVFGTIIPDAIKFGIPGLMSNTINFYTILADPLYGKLSPIMDSFEFWIILCGLVFLIGYLLLGFEFIDKKKAKTIFISNTISFIAIAIHLIMDIFIIEKSYWI
ncbi:hypothetical protein KAI32_03455 [Candidatus Pacearchaeota archaeon]|nr:hypothetical protein [Candidatus Pacearchaeota archaeon]